MEFLMECNLLGGKKRPDTWTFLIKKAKWQKIEVSNYFAKKEVSVFFSGLKLDLLISRLIELRGSLKFHSSSKTPERGIWERTLLKKKKSM